ncbi:LysR family transcriptional regulator [Acidocella sp.]|uniref:LysR family transcriptional regulator n=1 Tax=Acidocella sp. TaxID=50710 RepID=UPI0026384310|nr:LysR family transcriptional regulator [Acidocella sp.]MDD2795737.1 LysR family transcriptional regulator [Acidocella sp.]
MTLEQLRIFIAVAQRAHMTKAAAALGLGQSAVSAAIAALETRHGTKLFHRVGRGIALTEAGEQFLGAARAVLTQAEAAQALLEDLAGTTRGRLSLQASHTIASYWLPRHLVSFRRAYPGIEIALTVGNSMQVAQAVLEGTAELGLVEGPVEFPVLLNLQVARDSMILVTGPEHPWAGTEKLAPAQLTQSEWVLREQGSGTRLEFEHAVAGFGLNIADFRVALELPSNEAVRGAVEAGLGATALSASVAAPSLEAGLLRQVNFPLPERAFHLLRHQQRTPSRAGAAFSALIHPG